MNRNSPVPLWEVLGIGIVLLGGVYVLAQRAVVPPETSVIVQRPNILPSVSVSATTLPTLASPTPVASPTSSPAETAEPIPSDWKTYLNTKYGYQIHYPKSWFVSAPGDGEAAESDGTEAGITISDAVGDPGIDIQVDEFGTSDMGTGQFKSAQDLDSFIKLLQADPSTQTRLTFLKRDILGGQPSDWFTSCLSPYDPHAGCVSEVYLQNRNYLFEITGDESIDLPTTNGIIESMKFDGASH